MPRSKAMRAALLALAANVVLLALKAAATGVSDSLTIFSETLNSLADVVSAVVIIICVGWAWKAADEDHPFGHRRAEPIAGLVVAIFTGILGFEVCKTAAIDLYRHELPERIGLYPILALVITVAIKSALFGYFNRRGRRLNSPALRATAVDCRNDVFVAAQGLLAVVVAEYRLPLVDTISAMLIGSYIMYSGHKIGMENLDYLMGRAPDPALMERVRSAAEAVPGVERLRDIRGHYVGTFIHVELTTVVDGSLTTNDSHDICEVVRAAVESIEGIDRAFVHVAPLRAE